ncbi:HlyD family secretion protein [Psychrosphaera aestuarii]|uniref:HlyD family secretion protein n=1 Tax=Psychrosphaera aestuarii TaxID=1266052 RepID=UPI001B31A774|nr:efflux RND transporter periplasmic adaptor subunit [Psychrosphaera aestuarii]
MRLLTTIAVIAPFLLAACGSQQETEQSNNLVTPLSATGTLISTDSATISPPSVSRMWQYKIQYLAKENSKVKQGDIVVRFDPMQLRNDLMSKQSELDAAIKEREQSDLMQEQTLQDLKLAKAEAQMNHDKEKRKAEIVDASRSRLEKERQIKQYEIATAILDQTEQRLSNYFASKVVNQEVSDAQINRLTLEVNRIKDEIALLNVKAPKDGIVMYVTEQNGEKPAVGESIWQGRRVLTIPSLDKIAIQAQFDEPDTTKVRVGNEVKITLDAYPELPFVGKITTLGQSYKNKSNRNPKIVFDVIIDIESVDPKIMRPGMKVKVELTSGISTQGEV